MKICPTCNQTYSDQSLNFCLADGAVLNVVNDDNMSQPTVFMGQTPITNQNPNIVNPTVANPTFVQSNTQPNAQNNRGLSQHVPPRPVKKSKTWIWVLGILGVFLIVGGIGFIGLVALVATNIEDPEQPTNNQTNPTPEVKFGSILKDDFSKWISETNSFGTTEYSNGEYIMSAKQSGFFYVLITGNKTFKSSNATTKVTVRNVNGKETRLGYGLLIHSDPNTPLVKDFGFLIDSSKQSYRIVQHITSKETTLVNWTRFPAIRSGTQTNEIEIKDQNGKMSLYINGQFAVSIDDTTNYKDGIIGIYSGDGIPAAFSNLQIGK